MALPSDVGRFHTRLLLLPPEKQQQRPSGDGDGGS